MTIFPNMRYITAGFDYNISPNQVPIIILDSEKEMRLSSSSEKKGEDGSLLLISQTVLCYNGRVFI